MWFKTSKSTSQKITNTKSIDKSTQTNNSSKYVYANGVASSSNKYHKTATAHGMKGAIKMTENAAFGVAFHAFEWLFVRLAPIILIWAIVGIFLTRKKV